MGEKLLVAAGFICLKISSVSLHPQRPPVYRTTTLAFPKSNGVPGVFVLNPHSWLFSGATLEIPVPITVQVTLEMATGAEV
jgi:hypothetical protein